MNDELITHHPCMIGALKGTVFSKSLHSLLLFVENVGYTVHVTDSFLDKVTKDETRFLYIHSHIREDAFDLFGFEENDELHLFELLLTVSGVGPKTALFVLDKGVNAINKAIQDSDVDFFTAIPRLGKKNAQKIIIELKSKMGSITDIDLDGASTGDTKELTDALLTMGFKRQEIVSAIRSLPRTATTLSEKVKMCLACLGKSI